ncbi:alpha/beta fold hydrolase [Pseudonocardia sp. KRD291]|uniref:alpha/beta fold hydrolase n=1 Tax=Pseudonocardia sp. KRD291 TaxID=2792007 RepID=UPI001C49F86E|nr:alpha/beta hydrolase [Pseudonocardia sp. KRD291]MBW0102119.1 alpha/beta hydrolase [Pseudonocardia sp. KRD291]
MTPRFVLVHGAWHRGSCWSALVDELETRGFGATAPDLPSDRSGQGAQAYADAVLAAIGSDPGPVVLVGHSLGGLSVPLVAERLGPERVTALVLLAAMAPVPGTSFIGRMRSEELMVPGYDTGVRRGEDGTTFWSAEAARGGLYRGVAAESSEAAVDAALTGLRPQAWTVGKETTPLAGWPSVRTVSVVCTGDRVASPDAGRRHAAAVGAELVELPGGHFPMLTRPGELAELLGGIAAG